jgi:hypothetical protein
MSLRVVYATGTGHVLGALALKGAAGQPLTVADLVGRNLPLPVTLGDGTVAPVAMPASMLEVVAVDDQKAALVVPWAFGVDVVGGKPRPVLTPLAPAPVQDGGGPIAPVPGGVTVSVAATGVMTVRLPAKAGTDLPVLAVVANATGSRAPLPGTIRSGEQEVSFPMTPGPGPYGVLVLVAGWRGWLDRVTVQ